MPFAIKLPMTFRVAVWRVQDGAFKEVIIHASVLRPSGWSDSLQMNT